MASVLKSERRTYERQRTRLLKSARGSFVLIHRTRVLGVFGTEGEAVAAGYRQVGLDRPFFVHRVEAKEEEGTAHLGIYSASP